MEHSTAKLGGPASDIIIAKVGVSYPTPIHGVLSTPYSRFLFIAWAYEDDLDIDTCLG
jgi:hypothetical protein